MTNEEIEFIYSIYMLTVVILHSYYCVFNHLQTNVLLSLALLRKAK